MIGLAELRTRDDRPQEDHFVHFDAVSWDDYERFLAIRGDRSAPRLTYLRGVLEIMSPSRHHERLKSRIGRLVEVYCLERGVPFEPVGSWTLKERAEERGAEPDECYLIGAWEAEPERPHLAIEVVWTAGGLNKLEVYRRLGVGEVWYFEKGRLTIHVLRGDAYVSGHQSDVLPDLDLDLLVSMLDRPTAYDAIRAYRVALAESSGDE